ncbi:hypothetical protein [Deinococcus radiotolerans]|nr:hypothetical protein [Deinococcus radiotolerans]
MLAVPAVGRAWFQLNAAWVLPGVTVALAFLLAGRVPPEVRPWLVGLAAFDLTVGAGVMAWQTRPRGDSGHAARWVWPVVRGALVALLLWPWLRSPAWLLLVPVLAWALWHSARTVPIAAVADDLEAQLARVTRFAPHLPWWRAAAFEVMTLGCALRRRALPSGQTFPSTSGADGPFLLIGALITLEAVPVHFLLAGRSGALAALHLCGTALGLLWVVGQVRACRERVTTVTADALLVRCGLFWNARVPLADIAQGRATRPDDEGARACVNVQPNVTVVLRRPATLLGVGGTPAQVVAVRLHVDDPGGLTSVLDAARAEIRPAPAPA